MKTLLTFLLTVSTAFAVEQTDVVVDGIEQLRRSADFLKRKTAQYWG